MTAAPHRTTRTFAPEPVSAREARRFLRAFLVARDREDLTDAAELALSEVVTNAVLHAHTSFDVTAELAEDGELRVEVADRSSQLPAQRDYGAQATTGRGMQLVAALTAACGVRSHGSGGKAVWFVVRSEPTLRLVRGAPRARGVAAGRRRRGAAAGPSSDAVAGGP